MSWSKFLTTSPQGLKKSGSEYIRSSMKKRSLNDSKSNYLMDTDQ
jgi:hypothetical protein